MSTSLPITNGNSLRAWLAVLSLLMIALSYGSGYIGRQRADSAANSATQEKLAEIQREVSASTEKIDKMNERLSTQFVSRDLYQQFIDSQRDSSNGIKEQLTEIRAHQK